MSEYLKFRCCICPNRDKPQSAVCPSGGPQNKPESPCRFVKRYEDNRGWLYFVRNGIGGDTFKAFYLKPGKKDPHGARVLPWCNTFDQAQADLNAYAEKKKWREHA